MNYTSIDTCLTDSAYGKYDTHNVLTLKKILHGTKNKKQKLDHLSPILFLVLRTGLGQPKPKIIKALLDTGAEASILFKHWSKKLRVHETKQQSWKTVAGNFITNGKCKIQFKIPELSESRIVEHTVHISSKESRYDMIIGCDILKALGLRLNFSDMTIHWDEASIPMKPMDATHPTLFAIEDSEAISDATERIKKILDAKYEPADLKKITEECSHLSSAERTQLYMLLNEYKDLFDGTLGHWKNELYDIELKPGALPYHARPFPIPKVHEATLKMEVERLCELGVLK